MFFMHWTSVKNYESDESDFNAMLFSVRWRTRVVAISVYLVLADVAVMLYLTWIWLHLPVHGS